MIRRSHLFTVALVLLAAALFGPRPASANPLEKSWFVPAKVAVEHLDTSSILDARGRLAFFAGHVPNSVNVSWKDFSRDEAPHEGKLLDDDAALQKKLRTLGVSNDRPIIVVGDPIDGWGEDGRLVWMLRTLGHEKVAFVNGGFAALKDAGVEMTTSRRAPPKGDFVIRRRATWSADRADVRQAMKSKDGVLIDTREPREYRGATPYGEKRGGHVPGAKHIHYRELLQKNGRLKPPKAIRALLTKRGIAADDNIIAYCTGGVRSGWFVAVLVTLGYDEAKNYAGSMWDWAAAAPEKHPLEKKDS